MFSPQLLVCPLDEYHNHADDLGYRLQYGDRDDICGQGSGLIDFAQPVFSRVVAICRLAPAIAVRGHWARVGQSLGRPLPFVRPLSVA